MPHGKVANICFHVSRGANLEASQSEIEEFFSQASENTNNFLDSAFKINSCYIKLILNKNDWNYTHISFLGSLSSFKIFNLNSAFKQGETGDR